MEREFGIDLGEVPSQESFLANRNWVDVTRFNAEVEAAVATGKLSGPNAWVERCPDVPPPQSSSR